MSMPHIQRIRFFFDASTWQNAMLTMCYVTLTPAWTKIPIHLTLTNQTLIMYNILYLIVILNIVSHYRFRIVYENHTNSADYSGKFIWNIYNYFFFFCFLNGEKRSWAEKKVSPDKSSFETPHQIWTRFLATKIGTWSYVSVLTMRKVINIIRYRCALTRNTFLVHTFSLCIKSFCCFFFVVVAGIFGRQWSFESLNKQ